MMIKINQPLFIIEKQQLKIISVQNNTDVKASLAQIVGILIFPLQCVLGASGACLICYNRQTSHNNIELKLLVKLTPLFWKTSF